MSDDGRPCLIWLTGGCERYLIRSFRIPREKCSPDVWSRKASLFRFIPVRIKGANFSICKMIGRSPQVTVHQFFKLAVMSGW